jgi:menaquinone-dependent protoporphyrinogen oxidase
MGKFLVAYASKMGSTLEIAEVIGAELCVAGHEVDIRPADRVFGVCHYDAVVLGSAVYVTRWRREAVRFLKRHVNALAGKRVWLFQSGPCGDGHADDQVPAPPNVRRLAERIGAVPPVTFGGRLAPATARGLLARRMATSSLAGEYRNWDHIREWARAIGAMHATHR